MKIFPGICLLLWIAVGCEDMMTRKIEIDSADFPPRLAVSATLDTDSGRFTMTLYEGRSITSYSLYQGMQSIIRNGAVRLYQDGQLVWTLAGAFNLSPYKYSDFGSEEAYGYIRVTDIPAKAGSAYTLEIDMDGYEKAVSTVVMPADPLVDNVFMDTNHPVQKVDKVNYVAAGSWSYWPYYPVRCSLTDNTGEPDYYALQMISARQSNHPDYPVYADEEESGVGVDNLTLIQDNPDYEAQGSLLGDGESYDLYMFNTLLISDITFRGSSAALELFSGLQDERNEWNTFPERPSDYTPEIYGEEVIYDNRTILVVKHITAETFRHYRSLLLQEAGLSFFSEPVQITSNIQNGYGCFSLQNSRRIVLKENRRYFYPGLAGFPSAMKR
ncbi:MAG: DUF4249 domain-containing protein [Bacteroidales bacterium]|nr:DUF4249 domain-containing protein [Bacteroidales bacterium]